MSLYIGMNVSTRIRKKNNNNGRRDKLTETHFIYRLYTKTR